MIAAWIAEPGADGDHAPVLRALPGATICPVDQGAPGAARILSSAGITRNLTGQIPIAAGGGPRVAFDGWIDEADSASITPGTDAATYSALLARYGDRADMHLNGIYAAASWERDGTLRLARSPWRAPPLHFAMTPQGPAAASVLRLLFALGVEQELDTERLAHALWFDGAHAGGNDWYRGIRQVPSGSIVRIAPDGKVAIHRWYDPHAIRPTGSRKPGEWVEEGRYLLDRAANHAAARGERPAIALSSGLDSSLAADALVRAGSQPLALTLEPDPHWSGQSDAATYAHETEAARAFAGSHGLDHRSVRMQSWDEGLREYFRATDIATPFIANAPAQIAVARAAQAENRDWLFEATIGNDTISAQGHWAYAEYLRKGRWRELAKALRARPDDPRSMARKMGALALAPLLTNRIFIPLRLRFSRNPAFFDNASFLRRKIVADRGFREAMRQRGDHDPPMVWSRLQLVDFAWAASDAGQADFDLGLEQLTGVRRRDVLAYRPLIEFALSLPGEGFLREGTDRWLARELARGIMPEDQRTNPRMAAHHVDRHLRLTSAIPELRAWAGRLADHPLLGGLVDTERLQVVLADWPGEAPNDRGAPFALHHGIPNVVALGRFVAHVERRNDL